MRNGFKPGNGAVNVVKIVEQKSMDELLVMPTLEEELLIENKAREILASDDHKDIARLAVALMKQNWAQGQVLIESFERIHVLEAKLICATHRVEQPKKNPWWKIWTN